MSLNLRPVVTSWSYCSQGKWRIDYLNDPSHRIEALRHIFKTFHEAYTIFFKWTAYRKPYWKCLVKYSAHFVAYFFFKQCDVGEILVGFQGTVLCKRNANEIRCFSFFVLAKIRRNFVKALANFFRIKRNFASTEAKFRFAEISPERKFATVKFRNSENSHSQNFARAKIRSCEISTKRNFAGSGGGL